MADESGNTVRDYVFLERLGVGGFSAVYLAQHRLTLQKVVVKISGSAHDEFSRRLMDEARVLARLDHPNIATLYDVGTTADGRAFFVTEWIEGLSLSDLLHQRHALAVPEALVLAEAISEALDYAHAHGVIHRDIKPSNIFIPIVEGSLSYERAKLLDFGLHGTLMPESGRTKAGELYGTPIYMSPEQIQAKALSPASDIYSLGLVLYEILYEHTPFEAENTSLILSNVLRGNIEFPESPYLPSELRNLIRECTDKNPEHRPSTNELARRLSELRGAFRKHEEWDDQTAARTPPKPAFRHVTPWAPVCLILFIIAALALVTWFLYRSKQPISRFMLLYIGLAFIPASVLFGVAVRRFLNRVRPTIQRHAEAEEVLAGASSRDLLTKSIAIEVDAVLENAKRFDERLLAQSLALMVHEYQNARDSNNRQLAIMNTVQILEKLAARLSPWYIRHEKALAFVVSAVGVISGMATAAAAVVKIIAGKP